MGQCPGVSDRSFMQITLCANADFVSTSEETLNTNYDLSVQITSEFQFFARRMSETEAVTMAPKLQFPSRRRLAQFGLLLREPT